MTNAARTRMHGRARTGTRRAWHHRTPEGWDSLGLTFLEPPPVPTPFDVNAVQDPVDRWLVKQLEQPLLVREIKERALAVGLAWASLKRRRRELPIESEEVFGSDGIGEQRWRLVPYKAPARHPLNT